MGQKFVGQKFCPCKLRTKKAEIFSRQKILATRYYAERYYSILYAIIGTRKILSKRAGAMIGEFSPNISLKNFITAVYQCLI